MFSEPNLATDTGKYCQTLKPGGKLMVSWQGIGLLNIAQGRCEQANIVLVRVINKIPLGCTLLFSDWVLDLETVGLGTMGLKPGRLVNFYFMDYVNQCIYLDYSIFHPTSTWFDHEETISKSRRIFHSNLIIFICWLSIDITSTFPIIFALPHAQHSLFSQV